MKIEIDYNGALAVCCIEPMDAPDKMVQFNEADAKSQTYALSAFRTIKEHWRREKQLERFKKHPVIHVKRELQVMQNNFMQLQDLMREGVIIQFSFNTSEPPDIILLMNDNTALETGGWLLQDTEGHWFGMDKDYHRILQECHKIKLLNENKYDKGTTERADD